MALKAFLSAYLCNLMCFKMRVCADQKLPSRQCCKKRSTSVWLCDHTVHLCGYVTIFLARLGALFKECYSIQNTFSVLISLSCSHSLSQSAPESLARQCLASQGLVFSWHCWRKVCSFQSENRYSCCGCVCLLPTLLCACHCRCRADSGPNSHQALGPPGAGVWRDLLSCAFSVCSQPSKQDS